MIIECPACGARAKLPDSKEGAKVRCAECERIYLARPRGTGQASARKQSNLAMPIGIGAGIVALVMILLMVMNRDDSSVTKAPEAPEAPREAIGDFVGWNSKLVKFSRKVHDLAYERNEFELKKRLALPEIWARLQSTEEEQVDPSGFAALGAGAVRDLQDEVVASLIADSPENLVGSWKPVDGKVIEETDTTAIVRIELGPRSTELGFGSRNIEWLLVKDGSDWKAWSWARWYSEAELKSGRIASKRKVERKTLSDGSQVIEAETGVIAYMDSTSPELRARIDSLIEQLMNTELPAGKLSAVKAELRLIGKDAIPPLLTKFYELDLTGFPDYDTQVQGMALHEILGDITGYVTTFKAHAALGGTDERRDSGVRQWFGWYQRKFKRFEGNQQMEEIDLLEENIEFKSDAERREYEKSKRLIEQEEKEAEARRKRNGR